VDAAKAALNHKTSSHQVSRAVSILKEALPD